MKGAAIVIWLKQYNTITIIAHTEEAEEQCNPSGTAVLSPIMQEPCCLVPALTCACRLWGLGRTSCHSARRRSQRLALEWDATFSAARSKSYDRRWFTGPRTVNVEVCWNITHYYDPLIIKHLNYCMYKSLIISYLFCLCGNHHIEWLTRSPKIVTECY